MDKAKAIELLVCLANSSRSIDEDLVFSVHSEKIEEIKSFLKSSNIDFNDFIGKDTLQLKSEFYRVNQIHAYSDIGSFSRRFDPVDETDETIIIFGHANEESIICTVKNGSISPVQYPSGVKSNKIVNIYYLKKIAHEFLPKIADYTDSINKKYIFLSAECGRFEIDVPEFGFVDLDKLSLDLTYPKAIDLFSQPKGYEYIIKNRIIKSLSVVEDKNKRFDWLIKNLDLFIEATLRDLELFLVSQNHEDIIQQFENEKYIFADKIRGILEKISTNILSIPITLAIAIFGLQDISGRWATPLFFIALTFYVIFTCVVNILFHKDLSILNDEIDYKLKFYSRGLPFLIEKFSEIIKSSQDRIKFLQKIIKITVIIFIALYIFIIYWVTKYSPLWIWKYIFHKIAQN